MNDNTAAPNTADGIDTTDDPSNNTADSANQQQNAPARVLLNKIRVESSFSYKQSDRFVLYVFLLTKVLNLHLTFIIKYLLIGH